VDRRLALDHMGGDEELFADVVRLFLEDCPGRLAAIRSAVESRNAELIRSEAHGLKGAAANLSATALFVATSTLERLGAESRLDAAQAAWRVVSAAATEVLDQLRAFEQSSPRA
jgi:HPt (histidine-containing phosphotransfer) domain-containing protein